MAPHFSHLWKFGAGFRPAAGNRRQAFARLGKTEAQHGPTPENSRVRARLGKDTNTVRDLPGAAARLARRRRAGKKQTGRTALQAADALQAATRVTSLPVQTALRRDGACANCPPQVCPAQPRRCADPLFIPCKPFEKGWRKLSRGADLDRPCNFPASQVS